ncbi:hypothetical protein AB0D78_03450 [Streptomyces avermitilis]|uniref:hypothetical protein n=1 Tax=Streptomyces avermitilis TaxID=33903 RepID=UPI0033A23B34
MNTQSPPASEVQVVLTDCSATDAGHLFAALRRRFECDRDESDSPAEAPTAWTATFDTAAVCPPASGASVPLSGPVTAEVQGSPHAVRELEDALAEVFTVHEVGSVSGDQEVEVELRLEPRG